VSGCPFYASPTPEQSATFKISDPEVVLGCKNPVGGGGSLRFFVPVTGGAVRVQVCDEHGDLLARLYSQEGT
jgi:hypothetical protein